MNRPIRRCRAVPALAAILLAGTLAACGGGGAEAEARTAPEEAVTVLAPTDVATAELATVRSGVTLTGTLEPYRIAEVKAQVPGTVTAIGADAGEAVSEGEVLARIEAEGIRSQAAGAQAGVAAAQANLALARRQLESARTLYEAGAMSEISFQQAQAAYEAAQSQLAAARSQAATAGESARRTLVRAPFTGEVSARTVELGEAVSVGQTLFRVVSTRYLELQGGVGVNQATRLRSGQPVEFTLAAYPGRTFRGEVARVEPTADPATRQVGVYVRLPNEDRGLVGGVFATGRILTGDSEQVVAVPEAAVRGAGAARYVWVVEDGTLVRRDVTVGATNEAEGTVGVLSGVEAGEQVVVAPGELTEGARVRVDGAEAEVVEETTATEEG